MGATNRLADRYFRRVPGNWIMAKAEKKRDLRDSLPGHHGSLPGNRDKLKVDRPEDVTRTDDTHVASEPEYVGPDVGRNVPSGQTTKG
jgi:hypothetical protein